MFVRRRLLSLGCAVAVLSLLAVSACQLLLPFHEEGAQSDASAPVAEAGADGSADAAADTLADAVGDSAVDSDACSPGSCQPMPLAGGQSTPTCIRLHGGEVYWSTNSGSASSGVWHVPVDGGVPRMLVVANYVTGLTVDPNGVVYWADPSGVETYADGGSSTFVGGTHAQMVTADDASVYWSDWGTNKPIYAQPLGVPAASPSMPLYTNTGTAFGLIVVGGNLHWTANDTDPTQGLVLFGPISGGQATTMATGQANPLGISVDTSATYWANSGANGGDAGGANQAVWEQPNGGGGKALASGLSHPVAVWADPAGPYVYWVELGSPQSGYADGRVVRASKTGAPNVKVLATGQGQPSDIIGDDTAIYWANAGALIDGGAIDNGQIMKLPK